MSILIHNIFKYTTIFIAILLAGFFLPKLYKDFFSTKPNSPYIKYSHVDEKFYKQEYSYGKDYKLSYLNLDNKKMSKEEYAKLFPFEFFSHLIKIDAFPKKFEYIKNDPKILKKNSQFSWVSSKKVNSKAIPLYTLMEARPSYGSLEKPKDLYRLSKEGLEFIDLNTNSIKKEKSKLFTQALKQKEVLFPIKMAFSNSSTKKPFDDGTFLLDSKNELYHLIMLDKKPIVKRTKIINDDIKYINVQENTRLEFRAVMVTSNKVYLISHKNYKLISMPYDNYDYKNTEFRLSINPITKNLTFKTYDYKNQKLLIDKIITDQNYKIKQTLHYEQSLKGSFVYETIKKVLFPFIIDLKKTNEYFYSFSFKTNSFYFLILNFLLAFAYILFLIKKEKKLKYYKTNLSLIFLTGLYGLICILLFSKFIKNYDEDLEEI